MLMSRMTDLGFKSAKVRRSAGMVVLHRKNFVLHRKNFVLHTKKQ
jgi:hypothetical protein